MPLFVYRCGPVVHSYGQNKTWRVSHTIVAEEAPTEDPLYVLSDFALDLCYPFGTPGPIDYYSGVFFADELYPTPRLLGEGGGFLTLPEYLNPNAPEACFRVRRVGATGSMGRIMYPIPSDSWYTDLPHRRHVNAADLQPYLTAGLGAAPKTRVAGGVTYTAAIVHRRALTWTPVDHYEIAANPIRRWQRWKNHPAKFNPPFTSKRGPREIFSHVSRG